MNTSTYLNMNNLKAIILKGLTFIIVGIIFVSAFIQETSAAPHNSGYTFNASGGQYLNISDTAQNGLDITGDMTMNMWVKPTSLAEHMILASKWNHVEKTSYLLFLENGGIGIALNSNTSGFGYKVYHVSHGKNANEWFHVSMVYTAAIGTVQFFVNGALIGTSQTNLMPNSIANTDADFVIGGRDNKTNFYDGNIDDVRIWSRTLTSAMINDLYQNPNSFKNGELLQGYWKFNGNLKDYSGNKNHLILDTSAVSN